MFRMYVSKYVHVCHQLYMSTCMHKMVWQKLTQKFGQTGSNVGSKSPRHRQAIAHAKSSPLSTISSAILSPLCHSIDEIPMKSPLSNTEPQCGSKEVLGQGSSLALGSLGGFHFSMKIQSRDEDPGEQIVKVVDKVVDEPTQDVIVVPKPHVTYIQTCTHTYIHSYIHTYIHAYKNAYVYAYIHTYVCIYIRMYV